jgi:Response regulator containing CheY-like receiver domain and AraC-type DNA-binding domain
MYKLLIADDEISTREGLRDIINWNSLGFTVCGILEDGRDAIRYLEKNSDVNVIITDIKMSFQSGIDIAKYVYDKKLSTKLLFVSGYNEVELAMSAIKYNVNNYILKPIDIDLLIDAMMEIKEELDYEESVNQQENVLKQYERNIEEIRDVFFGELFVGGMTNKNFIRSMFERIYLNLSFDECYCFSLTLTLHDLAGFMENRWDKTANDFYTLLSECIAAASSEIQFKLINKQWDTLKLIGIVSSPQGGDIRNEEIIKYSTDKLCRDIAEKFDLTLQVDNIAVYKGISQILAQSQPHLKPTLGVDELLTQLDEQQKLIYSGVSLGNAEAVKRAVSAFVLCIEVLDMRLAGIMVKNLCLTIKAKISEFNHETGDSFELKPFFERLPKMKDFASLETELFNLLEDLTCSNLSEKGDIIEQAKRYIAEHVMDDISLEDVSERFYFSQYYFSRIFKAKTGETLINYIIQVKIEKAMSLLRNSHYKVYEICDMIGYKNNNYFTKVFKSYTGYTPNAYRNLMM